jgi:hypothetical protein
MMTVLKEKKTRRVRNFEQKYIAGGARLPKRPSHDSG